MTKTYESTLQKVILKKHKKNGLSTVSLNQEYPLLENKVAAIQLLPATKKLKSRDL